MPVDISRYPPEWKRIARETKERAGWKCEWCGVPHGSDALSAKGKPYKIVLTTAHVGPNRHDKMDCSSLVALCQPCHLRYDHADHVAHAAQTRRRKSARFQPALDLEAL